MDVHNTISFLLLWSCLVSFSVLFLSVMDLNSDFLGLHDPYPLVRRFIYFSYCMSRHFSTMTMVLQ